QVGDQAVQFGYLSSQAVQIDDDALLGAAGDHDDRLLVEGRVLLAMRYVRRDVHVVARGGLDAPFSVSVEKHEHRMPADDVDARLGLAAAMITRDHAPGDGGL